MFLSLFYKLLIITIISIVVKLFVFEVYYIPSSSMENTLKKGDYILVSKIHYGPRLPRNIMEIPIINIFAHTLLPSEKIRKLTLSDKPYKRVNLFSKVKKGDVIVFNTPFYQSGFSVKRCAKVPKNALYYMLGDNPKQSTDSRSWGLLQEDHIVGKAICVLYSKDDKKGIRWPRIIKKIK